MGTAASTNHQRTCPNDYDKDKFKMILRLYDKLDNDMPIFHKIKDIVKIPSY